MSSDRKHFNTDSALPSSISRGSEICTFNQLFGGTFTYGPFTFTANSYGSYIVADISVPYAVTPPIYLMEGTGGKLYAVDDTQKLVRVHHPEGTNYCLEKNTETGVLDLSYPSQAGIESGEIIANITGTQGSTFNWEGYVFTEGQYGRSLTSDPVITDI